MSRKWIWLVSIVFVALAIYVTVSILEKEMSRIEVVPDEALMKPMLAGDITDDPSRWEFDDAHAFFVEYRLERDRVRSQELEMLNDMINNPQVSEEARREAERQILYLVELMEKELTVENMLKAQGYSDVLLFGGSGTATVMVEAEKIGEDEFLRITEMVAAVTGVNREQVQVIQHN